MKLKHKILIGYGIVLLLMIMVVIWSIINIALLRNVTDVILHQNYGSSIAAEKMIISLEQQNHGMLMVSLGDIQKGIVTYRDNETAFIKCFDEAQDNMLIEGERELIESIGIHYEKYRKQFSLLTEVIDRKDIFGLPNIPNYQKNIYPIFLKVREECTKLRDLDQQVRHNASINADRLARRAILLTIIVSICGLATGLILILVLIRHIVKPLYGFFEAIRKISEGDYSAQVIINTKDELGGLANEFNKMSQQLDHYHKMDIERIITEKNKNDVIISSIDDGLVVFSQDLEVLSINPTAKKILGLESKNTNNLKYTDIIPADDICAMLRKTIETGTPPKEVTDEQRIMMLRVGEKNYQLIYSIIPTRDGNGNLTDILFLMRDVTRIKEIERIKNNFVMAASHELRTPLTSMGMSIDLLREHVAPKLNGKEKDLVITIHEDVQRMKSLTNDLLDLSRMEAEKISLELRSIPLKNIFRQVSKVFKNQLEIRDISLEYALPDDLPEVIADENKILWVLSNLISNASRYVNSGGNIKINAVVKGFYIHISVEDNGPGIPIEYQSILFQKVVQSDGRHTGVGLAICKEIVASHRGKIWFEPSQKHGSIFTFTLPIA